MNNKDLIETTKDIVVAMISSKLIGSNSQEQTKTVVTDNIESIYNKLVELNSKQITKGKTIEDYSSKDFPVY